MSAGKALHKNRVSLEPRAIAAAVLDRVFRDDAYAAAALDAELRRLPQLDSRDRGLITELVYGVLRSEAELKRRLAEHAPRGLPKQKEVRTHLLVAAYQLLALERIPAFAAVDAAVRQVQSSPARGLAGFANALLRRLASQGERIGASELAFRSAPEWLRDRLAAVVGADEARALLGAVPDGQRAPVAVRLVGGKAWPQWLDTAPPGHIPSLTRRIREGDPRAGEGYAEGIYVVQEEGAQLLGLALGARPGERILDACAGRGQKASLLAERVGLGGELWAVDLHPAKLEGLAREFERLGLPEPTTRAVDWSVGTGDVPVGFDRVLVDAPCSGVGTLRRRPEILRRLGAADPARLGALAAQILRRAASRARSGGRVVFAVCSVLPEECEGVVETVADELEPCPFDAPELASLVGGRTMMRLLPRAHGTDGYFVASLRRKH